MRVAIFQNSLGLGGTEKAAAEWAQLLSKRPGITEIRVVALSDGPRRSDLQRAGIQVQVVKCGDNSGVLLKALGNCDVVHAHVPGFPHPGDALGAALRSTARKIPVVQTNIFGKLENSLENEWTDFRLFISWTSCVQAARRSGRKLDREFFRKQSVAVYPVANPALHLDLDRATNTAVGLRRSLGISEDQILFGRFSRPEPNKWAPLALDAFLSAYKRNPRIRVGGRVCGDRFASHYFSAGDKRCTRACSQPTRLRCNTAHLEHRREFRLWYCRTDGSGPADHYPFRPVARSSAA